MNSQRSSMLLLPSIAVLASALGMGACSSSTDNETSSNSSGSSSSGSGGESSSTGSGGTGGTSPSTGCAQADSMLDVSKAPGAGEDYPDPALTATCTETMFIVDSNGIPHYKFIPLTPNPLQPQDLHYEITRAPKEAASPTELPLEGDIGFTVGGMPIFGPNEGPMPAMQAYGDPIYNGITDPCLGHTASVYHNHALAVKCLIESGLVAEPWMNADPPADAPSPIIGWSLDGFPILGPLECSDKACSAIVDMKSGYEKIGDPTKDAWDAYAWKEHAGDASYLDACNGHHGPDGDYHYHATSGFPYVLGCYKGTPAKSGGGMMGGPKSCVTEADCAGACPPGSQGCTCHSAPMGMVCVPTCSTSADCPMTPMGALQCNQGVCTP
jgi:hypothetical protein